eukprot:CAMPEP_0182486294 /NCGR_PEP_ID=MMETSP1319-20130603/46792_1 /TAXON_ID=172717 /ORGANISM="Bolidomonas pacifica, Strain RCC208" /LENGTH=80 /DNA_ID=CAMNT_0024688367 /DNA_START=226 /DNA_END=465 /DNA_ORIENTATION=+
MILSLLLLSLLLGLSLAASADPPPPGSNATNCTGYVDAFAKGSGEYKYCHCKDDSGAENIPMGIFLIICGSVSLNMGNNI